MCQNISFFFLRHHTHNKKKRKKFHQFFIFLSFSLFHWIDQIIISLGVLVMAVAVMVAVACPFLYQDGFPGKDDKSKPQDMYLHFYSIIQSLESIECVERESQLCSVQPVL